MRELWTCHLGEVEYREAVALQEQLRARVVAGELPDLLLLLEHPPVYTLGRRSAPEDLPFGEEGVAARGRDHEGPAYTGVWVEDRKIASIGVHLSKGVTAHGFAVNVDNDVAPFHQVTACGLPGVRMTSIALETGRDGGLDCFRKRMAYAYAQAHGLRQRLVSPARLETPVPSLA